MVQQRIPDAYMYASVECIFDKVHAFATEVETRLLVSNRRKKSEKTAQNDAKTAYSGQVGPIVTLWQQWG
ncbi:hypothetical protein MESS2_560029 [Mesorhizobium metallidurans STM 2683]|uniref:Uncharacterized protein n=1 Tax=Mesorhizobium metallidurans STM 2683 TaxID=1297569 RepID=M5F6B1_9HYPH|nr:hypothetical protein MESS2_560029 [Mesorhizobium metallidurans STM 2683]